MTGREVYNRINWDQRIDSSKVTIGYEDRFKGVLELPFNDPKFGGDVPWHRVQYFAYSGSVVWDRTGHLKLDEICGESAPFESTLLNWESSGWQPGPSPHSSDLSCQLTVLTWNVLFDLYDDRVPRFESRLPEIIALFKREKPALIALQEVTPKFARALMEDEFVRESYFCSLPEYLEPYGQMLLSVFPARCQRVPLRAGKSVLKVELGFLDVGVIHLLSNRADQASARRKEQLDEILPLFQSESLLLGDFNTQGILQLDGFQDLWLESHPTEPGLTFDALKNPLAAHTSRSGTRARLDRIFVTSPWKVINMETVAQEGLSDHEPLRARIGQDLAFDSSHQAALCIIPPSEIWPEIQDIRRLHDKGFERWMPHINLLYGFLDIGHLENIESLLKSLVCRFPSFRIRLREFKRFRHKQSTTVWLKPECQPAEALVELQAKLQEYFPFCHDRDNFTPHLTVASFRKGQVVPDFEQLDLEFEVDSIHYITREADTPFEITRSFPLASNLESQLPEFRTKLDQIQPLRDQLKTAGLTPHSVGSAALNLGLPESDIDLLVEGPLENLEAFLSEWERIPGRVSLFRSQLGNQKVEIQHGSRQALSDLDYIRTKLDLTAFLPFLRACRWWALQRGLDQSQYGFPGGFAWTLLAASSFQNREVTAELESFFELISEWPWPEPVCLNPHSAMPLESRDRFPILTPTEPFQNAAPNVTKGTLEVILQEARRGHALVQRSDWSSLFSLFQSENTVNLAEPNFISFLLSEERAGRRLRPIPGSDSKFQAL